MAVEIITSFGQQCDASGDPMNGAKVYVYDVGTTTLKSVFSDTGLSSAAANPIVCDSAGRHDMRYIATGSYKIVVKTSADVTVFTRDNIDGRVPVGSGALAIANGGTSATTAGAALTALGGASTAELAVLSAEVASLSGTLASTEKTHIATGTTAQRPATPANGDIRRNTTSSEWEGYNGSTWQHFLTESDAAAQADQETATSTTTFVSPGRQHFHPAHPKCWAYVTVSGGTPTLQTSHNITSITDTAAGRLTVTIATDFSGVNWSSLGTADATSDQLHAITAVSKAAGSVILESQSDAGTLEDPLAYNFEGSGDQA